MFVLHGLSVDVEDWFHILDCDTAPKLAQWDYLESRVTLSTSRLLDFLEHHRIRATFFILGWVAQRYPEIVKQVVERGHEIGSHGHKHLIVSNLTYDEFARDLDASLMAISRASGRDVHAFRAPGFSITHREFWAFKILVSRGIYLDSSMFLGRHTHGGLSLKRNRPFEIVLPSGHKLIEVPIVPCPLSIWNLPFSGGGYLRLIPTQLLKPLFKIAEFNSSPVITYIHSRYFDTKQPRMNLPLIRYFKYYVGLKNLPKKLEQLLTTFRFSSLEDVVKNTHFDRPLYIDDFDFSLTRNVELELQ